MISSEVEVVMHRCFVSARGAGHHFITVEHMVLEMLREAPVIRHLESCAIDVDGLRKKLEERVAGTSAAKSPMEDFDTQPTLDFQKVVERAILRVQKQKRNEVLLGDLLAAVLNQQDSLAATLLLEESARSKTTERLRKGDAAT